MLEVVAQQLKSLLTKVHSDSVAGNEEECE
jgi:hypothetical protein